MAGRRSDEWLNTWRKYEARLAQIRKERANSLSVIRSRWSPALKVTQLDAEQLDSEMFDMIFEQIGSCFEFYTNVCTCVRKRAVLTLL